MPATIGFVIPVLNEADGIAQLLLELRERFPDSELIVVDGGSSDSTVAAALPLCSRLLIGEAGRAAQMNLGGNIATADYVCFLHADTRPGLSAGPFQASLAGQPLWGFCRVRLSGSRRVFRLIEWFMNARSSATSVATGDQMLFVQRAEFERGGGFDNIPLMEDVAYCKRLRRRARPLVIDAPVLVSSRRWEQRGVVRTVLSMWCLRLAFVAGVTPHRLWHCYYGR